MRRLELNANPAPVVIGDLGFHPQTRLDQCSNARDLMVGDKQ